jgi:hypothetical protein
MVVYENVRCQWARVHGYDCVYGEGIIEKGMHQMNTCIKFIIKLNRAVVCRVVKHAWTTYLGCVPLGAPVSSGVPSGPQPMESMIPE